MLNKIFDSWSFEKKRNYPEDKIAWMCFISGFTPVAYAAYYFRSLFAESEVMQYIPKDLSLLASFMFVGIIFIVSVQKVYVQRKSLFYKYASAVWGIFSLFILFNMMGYSITSFLSNNRDIDVTSLFMVNDLSIPILASMILIISLSCSYFLDKYLMGTFNKTLYYNIFKTILSLYIVCMLPILFHVVRTSTTIGKAIRLSIYMSYESFYFFIGLIWVSLSISLVILIIYIVYDYIHGKYINV